MTGKLYVVCQLSDIKIDKKAEPMDKDHKQKKISTAITDEEAAELRTPKGENL